MVVTILEVVWLASSGAKHPTVQRAGPPAKNSPAPDVNSAKVGKHQSKEWSALPDPWNPGEVFFLFARNHIVFFVRSVPFLAFPCASPLNQDFSGTQDSSLTSGNLSHLPHLQLAS